MRILLYSLIFFIISTTTVLSQNLQVGVYSEETLATDVFAGTPAENCFTYKHSYNDIENAHVAGMQLFLSVDSVRGATGIVELRLWPYFQPLVMSDGDQHPLSINGYLAPNYFYFQGADTIYVSIVRKGIPILADQEYHSTILSTVGIIVEGCQGPVRSFYTTADSTFVIPGVIDNLGPECNQPELLSPGVNWFSAEAAAPFTGNIPSCWSDNPVGGDIRAIWYTFTTPANPATIQISAMEAFWSDSLGLGGLQLALYNSCNSNLVACSGGEEWSFPNILFQCNELLPNTQYYLLLATYPYPTGAPVEGVAEVFLNFYNYCEDAGCTDPNACNYDPYAQFDDGSCAYTEGCNELYNITVSDSLGCNAFLLQVPFPSMWGYWSYNGSALPQWADLTYFASEEPGMHNICFHSLDYSSGFAVACIDLFIPESCFESCYVLHSVEPTADPCQFVFSAQTALPLDTAEVQWNFIGANLIIDDTNNTVTFPSDGEYLYMLSINSDQCQTYTLIDTVLVSGCSGELIFGCMDPAAVNYNPMANVNDGSCIYPNSCEFELFALADSTNISNLIIYSTLNLNNVNYVFWSFGDGNTSTEPYPQYVYTGDGPYQLCVSVMIDNPIETCEGEACIWVDETMVEGSGFVSSGFMISVQYQGGITSVAEASVEATAIWPNPAENILHYRIGDAEANIRLLDISGRMVFRELSQSREGHISLDFLAPGVYFFESISAQGRSVQRFVKK